MQNWLLTIVGTIVALLPIANPLSTAPVFVTVTRGYTDSERNRQARLAATYMVYVLLGALFAGALILEFFGITVPVMRIAGGLIVARIGFGMLSPKPEQQVSAEGQAEAQRKDDIAFTPIAMPLLSGPGSIAVTISMATTRTNVLDYVAVAVGIVCTAALCWVVLRSSALIVQRFSATGMNALTRLMGFILICIGIQFIATGVFEALADPELMQPVIDTFARESG